MRRHRRRDARFAQRAVWIDRALVTAVLTLLLLTVAAQLLLTVDSLRAWLSPVDRREGLSTGGLLPPPAPAHGKERSLRTPE
jgi:hypothetical protein